MTLHRPPGSTRGAAPIIGALTAALILGCSATVEPDRSGRADIGNSSAEDDAGPAHPYVGMWVTADGHIRQELRSDGRYDEARGDRASAYTGRYEVRGDHIDYWDDSGFTADGTFVSDDELHHGGMVFYRQPA
ncbi:Atu4866 domain-containing protein [Mycobacterium sp. smrl_JER01]|uniref:Atu4866 domain-containing protein n=1 Tax=Mycobacterium sp. smrl_JER01 TaxID=3402633 RepID=UPI003ACDAEE5